MLRYEGVILHPRDNPIRNHIQQQAVVSSYDDMSNAVTTDFADCVRRMAVVCGYVSLLMSPLQI